ncbi:MAG: DUF368 domain-containing protein [Verrucomicrobia bacterium]|jgi:putative membrane protein|nr:DUF368 domain-containing protein [Verrucomicrobiota bacterium]|tara:strand:- start:8831 stop:9844 length:1014 start_codon:yes stop_codon:yes gene_type:complete
MSEYILAALKGAAMGTANIIPGVSGGTIAFITGIYERLINAIKSCGPKAVKLLFTGKLKEFAKHTDLFFLLSIALGAGVAIIVMARFLEPAFENHPIPTWAFFFGLILASIWGIGKMVGRWGTGTIIALLVGLAIAVSLLFLPHGSRNDNPIFLIFCGAAAISSMIIPGVSGSYVLLLLGNYALVLGAIGDRDLGILIPFATGCVLGLLLLSHILSWIFKHHHDIAVALITGFIVGSLVLIWPWKDTVYKQDSEGAYIVKTEDRDFVPRPGTFEEVTKSKAEGEELVEIGYANWHVPPMSENSTMPAILLALFGAALVFLVEWLGAKFGRTKDSAAL